MFGNTLNYQILPEKAGERRMKECVLYDRECIGCGECDRCDLDPEKICDNCMKCVNGDQEYRSILIDEVRVDKNSEPKAGPAHSS